MENRVAVVDPLPLYRRGVATSLSEMGLETELPEDIWAWTVNGGPLTVLIGLCTPDDWRLLADLHSERPNVSVVALIDQQDTGSYLRALRSGAVCALPRATTAEALKEVLGALLNGKVVLPTEVVQTLIDAQWIDTGPGATQPSADELSWLRALAEGSTVNRVAQRAGYSEREMFRRLRTLYTKLSASSRAEALINARDKGWI